MGFSDKYKRHVNFLPIIRNKFRVIFGKQFKIMVKADKKCLISGLFYGVVF